VRPIFCDADRRTSGHLGIVDKSGARLFGQRRRQSRLERQHRPLTCNDKSDFAPGLISRDVVLDFRAGDELDLSGIDANAGIAGDRAFTFVGNAAGELSMQRFGSINAAEQALGIDLDGIDGPSTLKGRVTVLLGDVDGGGI
jgi:hypothetical protein